MAKSALDTTPLDGGGAADLGEGSVIDAVLYVRLFGPRRLGSRAALLGILSGLPRHCETEGRLGKTRVAHVDALIGRIFSSRVRESACGAHEMFAMGHAERCS